jgi:hypothetical protein
MPRRSGREQFAAHILAVLRYPGAVVSSARSSDVEMRGAGERPLGSDSLSGVMSPRAHRQGRETRWPSAHPVARPIPIRKTARDGGVSSIRRSDTSATCQFGNVQVLGWIGKPGRGNVRIARDV